MNVIAKGLGRRTEEFRPFRASYFPEHPTQACGSLRPGLSNRGPSARPKPTMNRRDVTLTLIATTLRDRLFPR
jgi:hypothetical protein